MKSLIIYVRVFMWLCKSERTFKIIAGALFKFFVLIFVTCGCFGVVRDFYKSDAI